MAIPNWRRRLDLPNPEPVMCLLAHILKVLKWQNTDKTRVIWLRAALSDWSSLLCKVESSNRVTSFKSSFKSHSFKLFYWLCAWVGAGCGERKASTASALNWQFILKGTGNQLHTTCTFPKHKYLLCFWTVYLTGGFILQVTVMGQSLQRLSALEEAMAQGDAALPAVTAILNSGVSVRPEHLSFFFFFNQ